MHRSGGQSVSHVDHGGGGLGGAGDGSTHDGCEGECVYVYVRVVVV